MGIFEDNIAALEKKYGYLAEKIKNVDIDKTGERIRVEQAANGMKILSVRKDGRSWRLNSSWNPEIAAEVYAERYTLRLYGIYFVFGFSDGRCVREQLKKCDDTNLIVACEPDMETFAMACRHFDLSDLIEDKRLLLYFPELEIDADVTLQRLLDYTKIKLIDFYILPGYDVLYHEACESFMDSVLERMRNEIVNKTTHLTFNRSVPRHTLFHMRELIYQRNLEQLKRALSMYDLTEIPAIIVSAGPSLDKNVHLLKRAQGKAFIIAVDASIRTVIRAGARPDMLCSIDPNSPERFFEGLDLKDVSWSCTRLSNPDITEKYAERIFYHGYFSREWNKILEEDLGYPFPSLISGGSVSSEAFMLALYLGFRKLVLIGQDLAFTGGVSHTKGIEGALGDNDEYIRGRHIVEVEGIDGTMLETDFQMWYYKQWFERAIRVNQGVVRVIDATEGGAKIEGAEIWRFADVIDKECKQELDIYEIVKNIPQTFSPEKQQKLLKQLRTMRQSVIDFEKLLEKTIAEQEKRLALVNDRNTIPREVLHMLKEMSAENEKIEKEPILELVSMYAQKEEYEMGDTIYTEEELNAGELVEKSLALLNGYRRGAGLLKEDIDEYIMKD